MSQGDEDDDKQFEPTQKKLDDARKRGEVARSADLLTAAAYLGFLVVAGTIGQTTLINIGAELTRILADAPALATAVFADNQQAPLTEMTSGTLVNLVAWFALPGCFVLLCAAGQQALIFAPSKLTPKLSRISPLANAKIKFGRQGLFEFAKSFTKLAVYSFILGMFLMSHTDEVTGTIRLAPTGTVLTLGRLIVNFVTIVFSVTAAIGVIDFFWQRSEHLRRNRMSRKELVDENKQMEGDPHVKQQRRQRAQEIAMNRSLQDIPGSDVVIVNPTHYAVALKWSRAPGAAPVCVAKGVDEMAAKIREIAERAAVPIHRDPPAARAIYAAVDVGREIRPDHYRAVAAAIRFAELMRRRAGKGASSFEA